MKKFLALFLCITLIAGMIPAAALADTLYEYPPVNAYLKPNDMARLEYEFRQWAAETMIKSFDIYQGYSEEGSEYGFITGLGTTIEYIRMARTKELFDSIKGRQLESNIYNSVTMTDPEKQGMYLWVFLESIKEKMRVNADEILAEYGDIKNNEKRYWMIDVETGELKYDDYSRLAQTASNYVAAADWAIVGSNVAAGTADTVGAILLLPIDKYGLAINGLDAICSVLNDTLNEAISVCETNVLNKIDNAIRGELEADLSDAVKNISDAMLAYLKESYVNTNDHALGRDSEYYMDLIKNFVDKVEANRDLYTANLDDGVKKLLADKASQDIIDSIGYNALHVFNAKEIIIMVITEFFVSLLEEEINYLFDILPSIFPATFTFALGIEISYMDVIGKIKDVFIKYARDAAEGYLEDIRIKVREGKEMPDLSNIGGKVEKRILESIASSNFSKEVAEELASLVLSIAATNPLAPVLEGDLGGIVLDCLRTELQININSYFPGQKIEGEDLKEMMEKLLEIAIKKREGFEDELSKSYQKSLNEVKNKIIDTKFELKEDGHYYLVTESPALGRLNDDLDKLETEKFNISEKMSQVANVSQALKVILNVFDNWWEVGISLEKAMESTASAINGEGVMSMLGMRMVACRNMSLELKYTMCFSLWGDYMRFYNDNGETKLKEKIMNPDETPIAELYNIFSLIYTANQYDIVGSSAYLDMALQKKEFSSTKFAKYINDNHVNKAHEMGLLTFDASAAEYNYYVSLNSIFVLADEWRILFQ